jgi:predicted metal-dependent peptidase
MSKYLLQQKKMVAARMSILLKHGFFASVAMMQLVPDDKLGFLAATDGKTIKYNPQGIDKLYPQQLQFLFFHELMHCILMHHFRRKNRDPMIWNYACDYAVNALLCAANLVVSDTIYGMSALYNSDWTNMMAEEIYDILVKKQQDKRFSPSTGGGRMDDLKDYGQMSHEVPTQVQQEIYKNEIKEILKHSKKAGNVFLQKAIILELNKMDKPWYLDLLNMIQEMIHDDYSWSRPSPRYVQHGVYLPNNIRYGIKKIAFAIDTSGSMSPDRLSVAVSHIKDVVENIDAQFIDILQCNTNLTVPTETLTPGDIDGYFQKPLFGDGGTDFAPVFQYYNDNPEENPSLLIYHTDLDGPCSIEQPNFPVFWIVDQASADNYNEFGTKVVI